VSTCKLPWQLCDFTLLFPWLLFQAFGKSILFDRFTEGRKTSPTSEAAKKTVPVSKQWETLLLSSPAFPVLNHCCVLWSL